MRGFWRPLFRLEVFATSSGPPEIPITPSIRLRASVNRIMEHMALIPRQVDSEGQSSALACQRAMGSGPLSSLPCRIGRIG